MLWKILISTCVLLQIGSESVLVGAFKLENVHIPKFGVAGEDMDLYCYFTLGEDALYSLKWYKDGENFYSFITPESAPRLHLVNGVKVDASKSTMNRVHLKNLTQQSAGRYRCEINSQAPGFQTEVKESELKILVSPTSDPIIRGFPSTATVGDTLTGNCTSYSSKPAAALAFFINDEPVDEALTVQTPNKIGANGLETSTLGLTFTLEPKHMTNNNRLEIKCMATLDQDHEGMWIKVKIIYESQPSRRRSYSGSLRGRQSSTSANNSTPTAQALTHRNQSTPRPQSHHQHQHSHQVSEAITMGQHQQQLTDCPASQLIAKITELITNQNRELEKISSIGLEQLEVDRETLGLRREELAFLRGLKKAPIKSV